MSLLNLTTPSSITDSAISGIVLEKVCDYLYYNEKFKNSNEVPDLEIPPDLCLELLIAADYLNSMYAALNTGFCVADLLQYETNAELESTLYTHDTDYAIDNFNFISHIVRSQHRSVNQQHTNAFLLHSNSTARCC